MILTCFERHTPQTGSQLFTEFVAEIVSDFWAVIAWAPEHLAAGRSLQDINSHLQQGCVCSPQPAQSWSTLCIVITLSSGLVLGAEGGGCANYPFFIILFNKTQGTMCSKLSTCFKCSGKWDWLSAGL